MGHKIDKKADLELRDDTGKVVKLKDVAMTEGNRRRIGRSAVRNETLSREDALHDLEAFQAGLESQFAYLKANDVDYQAAIRAIAERTEEETGRARLAREMQIVMAQFIDGHAGVSGSTALFADGFLPFLIESSGDQYAAVRPDRSGLVDNDFPFLLAIEGVAMKDWLKATQKYVAAGSPQYRRRHGLRSLRAIQQFRAELGREQTETIEVELVSRDGKSTRTVSRDIVDRQPIYGTWPPVREPQILDGNIGYLRLASMNDEAVRLMQEWMPRFRDTAGLIIDVRGNGGGIRTPILELAGYLLSKDDEPRIGNVAKYRLAEHFGEDHLSAARFVYRENSPRFGERERAAIHRFNQTFKARMDAARRRVQRMALPRAVEGRGRPPLRLPPAGRDPARRTLLQCHRHSSWHVQGLAARDARRPGQRRGSARSQSIRLPRSGISVRCASMASFQPDGRLYDTNGVEPDIPVTRPPEYYVRGGDDLTLREALTVLRNRAETE